MRLEPPCPEYDKRARGYAGKYRFPMTAGLDRHSTKMLYRGMAFARRLKDIRDFKGAVTAGEAAQDE